MKIICIVLMCINLVSAELEIGNINELKNVNVDLNKLVDSFIPQIAQFIVNRDLDPLKLPDTEQRLWTLLPKQADAEPMLYRGDLVLRSGLLKYLSNLKRYGDSTLAYTDKILNMDIGFEFDLLEGTYDYIVKMVIFNFDGRMIATTEKARAKISISFNTTDYIVVLNKLELQTPGRIKIILENKKGQRDWINTAIINIATPFFQNTITDIVQKEATNTVQTYFDEINHKIAERMALVSSSEYQLFNRMTK